MQITKPEINDLKLFCKTVSELENSNAIKKCTRNTRILLSLREEEGKSVDYDKNPPLGENQEKFTRIIRQLLMDGERVNYYHISNILLKNKIDFKNSKELRSYWTEILHPSQRQIGLFWNDQMLSNEDIIKIFLYGGHIHCKDELNMRQHEKFQKNMGALFDFWLFNVMYDLTDVAIRTRDLIEKSPKEK